MEKVDKKCNENQRWKIESETGRENRKRKQSEKMDRKGKRK